MIVASLLLIAAAAVLLVLGLLRDIDLLLILSIVVSLLAAVALYVGARQSRTAAAGNDEDDEDRPGAAGSVPRASDADDASDAEDGAAALARNTRPPQERPDWPLERQPARDASGADERDQATGTAARPVAGDTATSTRREPAGAETALDDGDDIPADEPPAQRTPRADAELIARLPAEVFVVDGRPRYHVTGCPHLLDRDGEPLPVSEAAELGFSPCGWCQPDTVLLGGTPEP